MFNYKKIINMLLIALVLMTIIIGCSNTPSENVMKEMIYNLTEQHQTIILGYDSHVKYVKFDIINDYFRNKNNEDWYVIEVEYTIEYKMDNGDVVFTRESKHNNKSYQTYCFIKRGNKWVGYQERD